MSYFSHTLYFKYLSKLYSKNLFAILFGLSFTFAVIDYFQHLHKLDIAGNYQILYIFYMWQEALGLLYPLAIVFAIIMTKLSLIKNNTMGAFHAFGYNKKKLFMPFLLVASLTYLLFTALHTTEFSYAKDKAEALLANELHAYEVNDLFFKYNDTFVYIKKLDPIEKRITDITIFKVEGFKVEYIIQAPVALFNGDEWDAKDAKLKTHIYKDGKLEKYSVEYKKSIKTLEGYKPRIIESLYEGKVLNIIDAFNTWKLLKSQNINVDKIRATVYNKTIVPLFSLALLLILFFKLPFHGRMISMGVVIAASLGLTFIIWGILFGLGQIASNGVVAPEYTLILPIILLWSYAIYIFYHDENRL
ncbi:MAG: LptF/LptG family permease [Campylobacterota bacterium]|nr:LptF/LptG family permease [Campylobacterota bacterium]